MPGPWEKYQGSVPSADAPPWEKYKAQAENPSADTSFVRQTVNAATLGYLPEITAGVTKLAAPIYDKLTGDNVSEHLPSYTELRDREYKDLALDEKTNPKASIAGKVLGAIAGGVAAAPLAGAGLAAKGASLGSKLFQAGKAGALLGAATNPGANEGEIDLLQAGDRAKNAALGGAVGVAFQGGVEAVKGVSSLKDAVTKLSQEKAFKATGAKLKDHRKAMDRGQIEPIGQALLDEGIVTPGATPAKIAQKLEGKLDEIGSQIGSYLDEATARTGNPINLKEVAASVKGELNIEQMSKTPGMEGTASKVQSFLDTLVANGDDVSVRKAWELRSGIDKALKSAYKNKAFSDFPEAEGALLKLRNTLRDRVVAVVDDGQVGDGLGAALKKYSLLAEADRIATSESFRNSANRSISLTDTIAGSSGGLGYGLLTGDPISGIIGGAAVGAANKAVRTYGSGIAAKAAEKGAKALGAVESTLKPVTSTLKGTSKPLGGAANILARDPELSASRIKEVAKGEDDESPIKRRFKKKK